MTAGNFSAGGGDFGMTHPLFAPQMNSQYHYNPKDVIEIGKNVSVPLPGMPHMATKTT